MPVDEIKAFTPIIGIICATILGVSALEAGIDGVLFGPLIGAICLLSGYTLPQLKQKVAELKA